MPAEEMNGLRRKRPQLNVDTTESSLPIQQISKRASGWQLNTALDTSVFEFRGTGRSFSPSLWFGCLHSVRMNFLWGPKTGIFIDPQPRVTMMRTMSRQCKEQFRSGVRLQAGVCQATIGSLGTYRQSQVLTVVTLLLQSTMPVDTEYQC